MRLFVAAELPDTLSEALAETSARLRGCVRGRFVGTDSFHVTLAFLGSVRASCVNDLVGLVVEASLGHSPFSTTLAELGIFGHPSSGILWQGFDEGRDEWADLAADVRASLRGGGYAIDEQGFIPHVTLMRQADVAYGALPMPCVGRGEIRTVTLFESDLSGERPRYEALERVELRAW